MDKELFPKTVATTLGKRAELEKGRKMPFLKIVPVAYYTHEHPDEVQATKQGQALQNS